MDPKIYNTLDIHLKELSLPTMKALYKDFARQAEKEMLGCEWFFSELVAQEIEVRRANRIERFLTESKIPLEKTFETFERKRLPANLLFQVNALLDGGFIDRRENVLAFGNPGSGKTHLLCAIGEELVRNGRRIYFTTCNMLVEELLRAKQVLRLVKTIKKYSKYSAVIIDDLGYVRRTREEMEVLFTFLAERYERGSLMITSNLPFSKWEAIFKDPMTTAAAIDRLVHHSVILELNLPSYRMEAAKKRKEGNKDK